MLNLKGKRSTNNYSIILVRITVRPESRMLYECERPEFTPRDFVWDIRWAGLRNKNQQDAGELANEKYALVIAWYRQRATLSA